MKYKIVIDPSQSEDIILSAKEESPLLERLSVLLREQESILYGYCDGSAVRLCPSEIYCLFIEQSRVVALTDEGRYTVKERMYRLEELLKDSFIKINQSCLVNVSRIRRFDLSIGGALSVVLENGFKDYISRRQLRAVKERMGL